MSDSEMFAFIGIFNDLQRVFPKRLEEHERNQLHRDYFKTMRRFSLSQVQAGADNWLQRGKYFPKPAEWIDAIPTRSTTAADLPRLTEEQAQEWLYAERMRWEEAPCRCRECQDAKVTDKRLRFVPEFTEDDRDRRVLCGERMVTAGHWAHGEELARWYKARDSFYETFRRLVEKRSL